VPRSSPIVARHRLANGLRVVLHPDPELPLVAVNLWYHVGSKNERPGRTGFAHLFEHMLFQGSEHVGKNDHFRLVQQVGGVANGSTWYDRTNYYETLPASCLELGLWLESDRMGFLLPAMSEGKLENQRSVVMNERRQRVENQPYGRASERLNELLYPKTHPYHWPVIGYMDDIAAATLSEVEDFFRSYYTPDNAVLTLAGDLDPDGALDLVERYFGPIPRGPGVPAPIASGLPAGGYGERRIVLYDAVQLPRVYLSFAVPAFGSEEWYAANVLTTLLSEGKSSRLYHDLVYDRQIAQSVSAYVLPMEECATLTLVATVRPETPPDMVEEALSRHLAELADRAAAAAEVERARNHLLVGLFGELQALDNRADLLSAFTTFFDRPEDVFVEERRYASVESEQVRDLVQRYLSPERGVSVVVVPSDRDTSATTEKGDA
jgi:zinc protease